MPLPIRCSKRAKVKSEEVFFIQITESNSTKTLNTLAKKTTLLAEYLRKIRMEGYNSVCYCNNNRNLVCYFTKIAAKVVLFFDICKGLGKNAQEDGTFYTLLVGLLPIYKSVRTTLKPTF